MADKDSRFHIQDIDFSISEDELGIDLGIPRPQHPDGEASEQPSGGTGTKDDTTPHKRDWQTKMTARLLRGPLRDGVLKPVLNLFCKVHILGRDNLMGLETPIIVAANHSSHFDTPVIFEVLPPYLRKKMATAAAADHWFKNAAKGILPGIAYGAIAFPRKGSQGLKHCIELLQHGWSVLIFPEGTRSMSGKVSQFKVGTGRMAVTTQRPILPMALRGLEKVLPKDRSLPKRGDVWVAVGEPLHPQPGEDADQLTRRLETAVNQLGVLLDPYSSGERTDAPGEERPGLY
jgi:1-acyl-sn-glycerol-3-phosphate acyltransferase